MEWKSHTLMEQLIAILQKQGTKVDAWGISQIQFREERFRKHFVTVMLLQKRTKAFVVLKHMKKESLVQFANGKC